MNNSIPNGGTLNKEFIDKIINELNQELINRNSSLEVTVYGGSCLCLLSKYRESTYDVDLTSSDDDLLEDCISSLGYPKDMVNTEMSVFINLKETLDLYEELSNLKVYVPTLPYLLALKIKSARGKDFDDCVNLCKDLGIKSLEEIKEVFCRYYSVVQFSHLRVDFCNSVLSELNN